MKDQKLLEIIADVAYMFGENNFFTGDSRADIQTMIYLAKEFESINFKEKWINKDYIEEIQKFTLEKLETLSS
jgi:hypothetical protein